MFEVSDPRIGWVGRKLVAVRAGLTRNPPVFRARPGPTRELFLTS